MLRQNPWILFQVGLHCRASAPWHAFRWDWEKPALDLDLDWRNKTWRGEIFTQQGLTTAWRPMEVLWRTEQVSCSLSRCVHIPFVGFPKILFVNFTDNQDLAGLQVLLTNTGVGRNTKALVQGWDSSSFLLYLFRWHSHFLSEWNFTFIHSFNFHFSLSKGEILMSLIPSFSAGTFTFLSEWDSSSINSTHLSSSLSLSHESERAQLSLLLTLSTFTFPTTYTSTFPLKVGELRFH